MIDSILALIGFIGLLIAGFGFLDMLAGGMADGDAGDDATRDGAELFKGGLCLTGICIMLDIAVHFL
jgi:hypothetical protein